MFVLVRKRMYGGRDEPFGEILWCIRCLDTVFDRPSVADICNEKEPSDLLERASGKQYQVPMKKTLHEPFLLHLAHRNTDDARCRATVPR